MTEDLKELWRYRELLGIMVRRELRVRYKNSALGFLWSFLTPLATTLVVTIVFSMFLHNGIHSYSAYYLAAFLPFMFLQSAILDSSQSVLSALPVVKKIYFPRELLPLSNVISNFIHLVLGFVVFFLYLVYVYIRNPLEFPLQSTAVWLPLLLLITLMLGMGLAFFASALNTFYEDVKHILSVAMYLMFFMCPIMYFVEQVANSAINRAPYYWVYKLYLLNPFACLCIAYRKILLAPVDVPSLGGTFTAQPLGWRYLAATAITSVIVLVWGYATFNRMKWRFVERP
jgi:lipopolysaccharide transport system permease protein